MLVKSDFTIMTTPKGFFTVAWILPDGRSAIIKTHIRKEKLAKNYVGWLVWYINKYYTQ